MTEYCGRDKHLSLTVSAIVHVACKSDMNSLTLHCCTSSHLRQSLSSSSLTALTLPTIIRCVGGHCRAGMFGLACLPGQRLCMLSCLPLLHGTSCWSTYWLSSSPHLHLSAATCFHWSPAALTTPLSSSTFGLNLFECLAPRGLA